MYMYMFMLWAGIFASLAALMFNCVRREDIDYSPYDDGEWRSALSTVSIVLYRRHLLSFWIFRVFLVFFLYVARILGFGFGFIHLLVKKGSR